MQKRLSYKPLTLRGLISALLMPLLTLASVSCKDVISPTNEHCPEVTTNSEDGLVTATLTIRANEPPKSYPDNKTWWMSGNVFDGMETANLNLTIFRKTREGKRYKYQEKMVTFKKVTSEGTTSAPVYQTGIELPSGEYEFYVLYYHNFHVTSELSNIQEIISGKKGLETGRVVSPGYYYLDEGDKLVHSIYSDVTTFGHKYEDLIKGAFPLTVLNAREADRHAEALLSDKYTDNPTKVAQNPRSGVVGATRPLPLSMGDKMLNPKEWSFEINARNRKSSSKPVENFFYKLSDKLTFRDVEAPIRDVSFLTFSQPKGVRGYPFQHATMLPSKGYGWNGKGGGVHYTWSPSHPGQPNLPFFPLFSGSNKEVRISKNSARVEIPLYRDFARLRIFLGAEPFDEKAAAGDKKVTVKRTDMELRAITIFYPSVAAPGYRSRGEDNATRLSGSIPSKRLMDKIAKENQSMISGVATHPLHAMMFAYPYGAGTINGGTGDERNDPYYPIGTQGKTTIDVITLQSKGLGTINDKEKNIAAMNANPDLYERYIGPQYVGAFMPKNNVWDRELMRLQKGGEANFTRPTLAITIECKETPRYSQPRWNGYKWIYFDDYFSKRWFRTFFIPLASDEDSSVPMTIEPNREYKYYIVLPSTDTSKVQVVYTISEGGIKVLPWERVDQEIEVDPNGPTYQEK